MASPQFHSELLRPTTHQITGFDCGVEPLNRWLIHSAAQEAAKRVANTFVWTPLTATRLWPATRCAVMSWPGTPHPVASAGARRGVADPIPAALIAKLALSSKLHDQGWAGNCCATPWSASCEAASQALRSGSSLSMPSMSPQRSSTGATAFTARQP